ncbi:MAG: DUF3558 family protein [Pseudolysinimonas sp.]
MHKPLIAGALLALTATLLVGCSTGAPSESSSGAPSGSAVPPTAQTSGTQESGLPADVCAKLPLARVNQLTGLNLTNTEVIPPQGYNAAECQYMNAATVVDASDQVNALVVTGDGASAFWEQTRDTTTDGFADLAGVGKRAYVADGIVAVDYGNLVIIVDDWASTGDTLEIDQLRFLVDELHNLYS